MANLFDMKKQRAHALAKAEGVLAAAETAHREMTTVESLDYDTAMAAVNGLTPEIAKRERMNTIQQHLVGGKLIPAGGNLGQARTPGAPVILSEQYYNDFFAWIGSHGQQMGAALYEGTGSAGGFTVPLIVEGQIIPLAPQEMGVRSIATVVPTSMDIRLPRAGSFGTASLKAESGASGHSFQESDPSLEQFTLSAFMAGVTHTISWELAEDVPTFQQFAITDLILSIQMLEDSLYVNGSGTGEAQGLIGNVGTGVTGVAAGSDSYASELMEATFDVLGDLNAAYHPGASWLMARATGVAIRKAQQQANLFVPIWTREGGKDYLHGYPVTFSAYVPAIGAGNTPVLFGDFKQGYIVGDRGGSGINV
jgi:HK97 family phage major capsid protein